MRFMTYFSLGALAVFMLGALLENSGYDSAPSTTSIHTRGAVEHTSP